MHTIPLVIFSFILQRLVNEKFHFKRKNPTFRPAIQSKMISLQDFPRIPVTKIFRSYRARGCPPLEPIRLHYCALLGKKSANIFKSGLKLSIF